VDLTQKAICMVFHGRHWTDLQLHADSVYFSLEQDAEDWARLQADTALALPSPNLKYGLDSIDGSISRVEDRDRGGYLGANNWRTKSFQMGQSVSGASVSPKQVKILVCLSSISFQRHQISFTSLWVGKCE
jgi:hypothetical protein